jgi:hypothetical protein
VELFPLEGFLDAFGGDASVIGIFDGRLRVPLADIRTLRPEIVAIVSHELLHALLSQASRDGAPHWFQEGLAQWIETGTVHLNPYPDLERRGRTLSFPLLEPILRSFSEPRLVELAYAESLWSVAFLHTHWGEHGIRRLMELFAAGASTQDAITALTGLTLADFDGELRAWAAEKAPVRRYLEPRRFDQMEGALFERGSRRERSEIEPMVGVDRDRDRGLGVDREAMKSWFSGYRQASAALWEAYAPIQSVYLAGAGSPSEADCRQLGIVIEAIRAEPAALTAPDLRVGTKLRALLDAMARLSKDCAEGRLDAARVDYDLVSLAMRDVQVRLQPYGLAP